MEKEISNGAMLGIVLIALAAIIGLGFGVFAIAKGVANEGVTNVQENLDVVGNSVFTDYDQKIVTGTQVMSAVQNFEGKPYSILIATQATIKEFGEKSGIGGGSGILTSYKSVDNVPVIESNIETEYGTGGTKVPLKFINYNAKLGKFTGSESNGTIERSIMTFDQNCYRWGSGLVAINGKIQMNGITGNLSKSGMMEYVPSGARFQAYLIKDDSGTILGIAFEQINAK